MTPATQSICDELYARFRRGDEVAGEERLDDWEHCHWPEGCHPGVSTVGVEPEELDLGIPAGTFVAIRRLWRRGPLPARYGGQRS